MEERGFQLCSLWLCIVHVTTFTLPSDAGNRVFKKSRQLCQATEFLIGGAAEDHLVRTCIIRHLLVSFPLSGNTEALTSHMQTVQWETAGKKQKIAR